MTREELFAATFAGTVREPDESLELKLGDDVLGHVGLYWRTLSINGREVEVGGIGAVATAPDARRRGIASFLVEQAHLLILRRGLTVAALFCDEENYRTFYEDLGYIHEWRSDWPPNLALAPLIGSRCGGVDILGAIDEPSDRW